jgi:predicted nucleic acid-binding protein
MKAVGLDTTVVVRLLTGEPAAQAHAAKAYLENAYASGVKLVIHDLVVIEAYHALIYHYEVPKAEAVKIAAATPHLPPDFGIGARP